MRNQLRCMLVWFAAVNMASCGSFTNTSVVSHQLSAKADQTLNTDQPEAGTFGVQVQEYGEDGSVKVMIDDAPELVVLRPDVWIDLPLRGDMRVRRLMLLESDSERHEASMVYKEGYESGPPVLRHL